MMKNTGHNVVSNGKMTPRMMMVETPKLLKEMGKAFVRNMTGRDGFTKQLQAENKAYKAKRGIR